MQLNQILGNAEDQERGAWLELRHPVSGKPTGIKLLIVGPDSATQAAGRLAMADELARATDDEGRVSAEARDRVRVRALARCVKAWEILEDGEPVPFKFANVVRVIRAAAWLQAQVDAFAGDRRNFMEAEL